MSVADATLFTLDRISKGENTISVTGNVLRDYLTDLFPILELGTSAKMLEFLALAVSLEHLSESTGNAEAAVLAKTLDSATELLLNNGKSPSRKVGEIDTRGSHFYLALYWAQALASQTENQPLADKFAPLAKALSDNEEKIFSELNDSQGSPTDVGGYYYPDIDKGTQAMRPSDTLNTVINGF